MNGVRWKRAVDGAFDKEKAWKGGAAPGPRDAAILDAAGSEYVVTSANVEQVKSISLAGNATLNIDANQFYATDGTGRGENAGVIAVYGTGTFAVGGSVNNIGLLTLNNSGTDEQDPTTLFIASSSTFMGGGNIELSDSDYNYIEGTGVVLTNVDNTISGAGWIGAVTGTFTLVNEAGGVIDSTGENALMVASYSGAKVDFVNDGTLEATGTSGLAFENVKITGSGGQVVTAGGAYVGFLSSTVSGQSFSIQADGVLGFSDSVVYTTSEVTNSGRLLVGGRDGMMTVDAIMHNDSELLVNQGELIVTKAVTGSGIVVIIGGIMEFDSSFTEDVQASGRASLILGRSQHYTGAVSGLFQKGVGTLDVRDIAFVSAGEATFSGTSSSGVLTISDGVRTANIRLSGRNISTTYVASDDGHGGTVITGEKPNAEPVRSLVAFVSALAGFAPSLQGHQLIERGPVAKMLMLGEPK